MGVLFWSALVLTNPPKRAEVSEFPLLGFYQNSRLVLAVPDVKWVPPKKVYAFPLAPLSSKPDRKELKERSGLPGELELTKTREELSSIPAEKSFFVPTETRAAHIYKMDFVPPPIRRTPTPMLVFSEDANLFQDFIQRWVSLEDVEFQFGRFTSVERSIETFFPAYITPDGKTQWRLLDLENGSGSSLFLQTVDQGECSRALEYSFFFPDQNHRTVNEEIIGARCGGSFDFP